MNFWAIAYKYQEDVFYDFSEGETTFDLKETSFLPTREMANDYIEDVLGSDFVPVEVELESLSKDGVYVYSVGKVDNWE